MSLVFYFAPMSTAEITAAVLAELNVPHERVPLDIGRGDTREPKFLAINPNGRVPAIVHDGVAIWESAAITLYLGETFGVALGLFPAPGTARGEAMKWIVWSNVMLAEAGSRLAAALPPGTPGGVQETSRDAVPPERRQAGAAEQALADLATGLRVLEDGLAGRSYLLGGYSLADTHVQGIVGWLGMMGTELGRFPNVTAWLRRCGERPALARSAD